MVVESLLGGIFGGLLRIAPEVMKLWDRKSEREHEFRMAGLEMQIAEKKLEFGMRQTEAMVGVATLDAIGEALKGQSEMATAGGKFVAGISALVRPLVTYWMFFLYSAHKIALMLVAYEQSGNWRDVFITTWTEQDWVLLSAIATFWFVSRVYERRATQ
jgi:hypothetical protein